MCSSNREGYISRANLSTRTMSHEFSESMLMEDKQRWGGSEVSGILLFLGWSSVISIVFSAPDTDSMDNSLPRSPNKQEASKSSISKWILSNKVSWNHNQLHGISTRRHTESQWLGSHFYFLWNILSSHPEFVEYMKITFTLSKQSVWAQSSQRRHRVRLLLLLHVITIITQPSSERESEGRHYWDRSLLKLAFEFARFIVWVSLTGNLPCNTICV